MAITALLVAAALVAGAIVFAVVRAVALWRTLRAFTRTFGDEMAAFATRVDALAAREPDTERLGPSLDRLRRSNAQLSVLLNALGRVREQWAGLAAVYPKK